MTETKRIECSPGFARALLALGVRDQGGGCFYLEDVQSVIAHVGGLEAFLKHIAYHYIRHARGLDVLEDLAAEVRELARVAAMPTKLVRDKTGRSVGAKKVPGLGRVH
jgi:hypothetical protein